MEALEEGCFQLATALCQTCLTGLHATPVCFACTTTQYMIPLSYHYATIPLSYHDDTTIWYTTIERHKKHGKGDAIRECCYGTREVVTGETTSLSLPCLHHISQYFSAVQGRQPVQDKWHCFLCLACTTSDKYTLLYTKHRWQDQRRVRDSVSALPAPQQTRRLCYV